VTPTEHALARALKAAVFTYHLMTEEQGRALAADLHLPPSVLDDAAR